MVVFCALTEIRAAVSYLVASVRYPRGCCIRLAKIYLAKNQHPKQRQLASSGHYLAATDEECCDGKWFTGGKPGGLRRPWHIPSASTERMTAVPSEMQ